VTDPPVPEAPTEPETAPAAEFEPSPPIVTEPALPAEAQAAPREKPPRSRPRDAAVMRAYRTGLPLDGTVEKVIKGGYEVRIGKSRGFCPHSQIDLHRVDPAEEMVGKTFPFRVIQVRRGGDDVVLSRRSLLEEQRLEEAKAVRATLLEGAVLDGHVARIADFGAFVDLGAGVTGLVHVTEMAHNRVASPSEVVSVGDRISVKILKIDETSGKISLSIRQATSDPWLEAAIRLKPGQVIEGSVLRLADFGAFVELADGIEALVPARECPPLPGGWREALAPGTKREFVVLSTEPGRRRATVLPWMGEGVGAAAESVVPGAKLTGKIQKIEGFGLFVWLGPGRVGLVPRAWTGLPPGSRLDARFRPGEDLPVEVHDVSEDGHRIRLGIEGVPREEDREPDTRGRKPGKETPPRVESSAHDAASDTFGTSLGDALRAALQKK
jgi:small subunit ribosomal protein S1